MVSQHADISVVIPAYNAEATIGRALVSVATQSLKPKEVIVVDDGSNDRTLEIANKCRSDLEPISLYTIASSNQGAGAARNKALRYSTCSYVAFLDADDEWLENKLQESMDVITSQNRVFVAHNGWVFENNRRTYNDIASHYVKWQRNIYHGLYRRGFVSTSSVVARLDAITAVGMFDEELIVGQDFDLWLKLANWSNSNFEIFDKALTYYHVQQSGITRNTGRRLKHCLVIAIRHAPELRCHPGRPILSLWFRVSAVYFEAFQAYRAKGENIAALITSLKVPAELLLMTVVFLFGNIVKKTAPVGLKANYASLVTLLSVIWVFSVFVIYLYDLVPIMPVIFQALKLQ